MMAGVGTFQFKAHAYAANIKAIRTKRFIAPRLTPRPPPACKNKVYPLQAVDTALDCRPFRQKARPVIIVFSFNKCPGDRHGKLHA